MHLHQQDSSQILLQARLTKDIASKKTLENNIKSLSQYNVVAIQEAQIMNQCHYSDKIMPEPRRKHLLTGILCE